MQHKILASLLIVSSSLPQACASCVGHFNNQSNFQWSISGYNGEKSSLIVPPNTIVEIPWGTATKIVVSGVIPNRPYTRQFQVQPSGDCVVINHQGNTGLIQLNKPANGDVVTCVGGC